MGFLIYFFLVLMAVLGVFAIVFLSPWPSDRAAERADAAARRSAAMMAVQRAYFINDITREMAVCHFVTCFGLTVAQARAMAPERDFSLEP